MSTGLKEIKAGVPQGSVLVLVLYLLHASEISHFESKMVAGFTDEVAILAVGSSNEDTTKIHKYLLTEFIDSVQRFQIKALRKALNPLCYIRNNTLIES